MTEPSDQMNAFQIDANRVIQKLEARLAAVTSEAMRYLAASEQLLEERNALAMALQQQNEAIEGAADGESEPEAEPTPPAKRAPRKTAAKKAPATKAKDSANLKSVPTTQ